MFELRLNTLNNYVDKFIVSEANYTHSGKPKKLNFNINDYPKFKDKIIYIKIDKLPHFNKADLFSERTKSIKIISYQRNKLLEGLSQADNNDFIIYSDCDEIPNIKNLNFSLLKKITIFKQKSFYYKFNLELKTLSWYGSRGCKKKDLIDFEWLRQIKPKQYRSWRIDTIFKKDKYRNINIIENGGWHFSQLKSPEEIFKKVILVLVVLFVFVLIRNIYRTYKYCGINPKCYWKNKYYTLVKVLNENNIHLQKNM
jgi:beta-1,4-mannosyl-glycoprotein beta-1,4-N-acetylglucosaminyltransferase